MGSSLLVLSLFSSLLANAWAYTPHARVHAGCVILLDRLYCYGGGWDTQVSGFNTLNDHFYLDLKRNFTISNAHTLFEEVPNPSGFKLEPNYMFSCAALDKKSYMITSGLGDERFNTKLVNITTVFRATDNRWQGFRKAPFNQTEGSTLTHDGNGTTWLWGGKEMSTDPTPSISAVYRFHPKNKQWTTVNAPLPASVNHQRLLHAAAFANNKIYYISGQLVLGTMLGWADLATILVFDVVQQVWSTIKATGASRTPRQEASLTYLPETNQLLLYGGRYYAHFTKNDLSDSYCWVYDIATKHWIDKTITLSSTEFGAGARYGHSAVLHGNRYLFIAFGFNSTRHELGDVHVLDTQTWRWMDSWTALPDASGNGNSGDAGVSMDVDSEKGAVLGGGAIAGIVVGGVVAVIGLGGLFFFMRRRRENQEVAADESNDGWSATYKDMAMAHPEDADDPRPSVEPIYDSISTTAPLPVVDDRHAYQGSSTPLSSAATATTLSGAHSVKPDTIQ